MSPSISTRFYESVIRGTIWAFIGVLYATLFISSAIFAEQWQLPIMPYFFAALVAGTLCALIYSSMRLAVVMAALLFPLSIVYFSIYTEELNLMHMFKFMVPSGIVLGALYGLLSRGSRICRADAKALAGFCSSLLVGLGYLIFNYLLDGIPLLWSVGVMCGLTGVLYVSIVPVFVKLYEDLLPPFGDGALAGGCIAIFITFCSYLMAGSIDIQMEGLVTGEVAMILKLFPQAAISGLVGAGMVGILSGMVLTNWQDL